MNAPDGWVPRPDDEHDTWFVDLMPGYRVYAVRAAREVEFLGIAFTPGEARAFSARLAQAADIVEATEVAK